MYFYCWIFIYYLSIKIVYAQLVFLFNEFYIDLYSVSFVHLYLTSIAYHLFCYKFTFTHLMIRNVFHKFIYCEIPRYSCYFINNQSIFTGTKKPSYDQHGLHILNQTFLSKINMKKA